MRPDLSQNTRALSLDIRGYSGDVQFALDDFFQFLPSLRKLSLTSASMHSLSPSRHLQNLTSVQLDVHEQSLQTYPQENAWWQVNGLDCYMSLRSLRRVQIKDIDCVVKYFRTRESIVNYSVNDLCFLNCCAYKFNVDSLVADFISWAKHLKRFAFELNYMGIIPLTDEFKAMEVVLVEKNASPFTSWPMGSLKGCNNFKRLAISIFTTFGDFKTGTGFDTDPILHNYLPPQLEEIQIQIPISVVERAPGPPWSPVIPHAVIQANLWYRKRVLRIRSLAYDKNAYLPGLKRVVFGFQESRLSQERALKTSDYWTLSKMDELTHAFEDVGVRFECICTPFFKDTPFGQRVYEW